MHRVSKFRLFVLALIAPLPSFLMRPCYRLFFGYQIGKRVHFGFSIIDAAECQIEDDVRVGHLNVIIGVQRLTMGDHVRIGHLNIVRGGEEVRLGRYSEIMRMNEINSIPEPDAVNPVERASYWAPGVSSQPVTRSTSPIGSTSAGGRLSVGATLHCGRTTGSARGR